MFLIFNQKGEVCKKNQVMISASWMNSHSLNVF